MMPTNEAFGIEMSASNVGLSSASAIVTYGRIIVGIHGKQCKASKEPIERNIYEQQRSNFPVSLRITQGQT